MEAVQKSFTDVMALFEERMTNFEEELHKAPKTSVILGSLEADFFSFKKFILEALGWQQVAMVTRSVDNIEMQGRRKILLLHGVAEEKDEDTVQVVTAVVRGHLKLGDFAVTDIRRCHRMGRSTSTSRARPILVKLQNVEVRDKIWFSKTSLKGSGVTLSEFLTRSRHLAFMAARERFGVSSCWTRSGCVYILDPDGTRHKIVSLSELNGLALVEDTTEPVAADDDVPAIRTARPKRAAADKK